MDNFLSASEEVGKLMYTSHVYIDRISIIEVNKLLDGVYTMQMLLLPW